MLSAAALFCVREGVRLARVRFSVERPAALALSLGEREEIPLTLRSNARSPLGIVAKQLWPELVSLRSTRRSALLAPGQVVDLTEHLDAVRRGTASLAAVWVAATFEGWLERRFELAAPCELSVLPNTRAIRRATARLDRLFLSGLGARPAPKLGQGREFERLRDYVTGDDPRDVAWKASARHGKLIVREFRLDRAQDVLIAIDAGHRMAARVGPIERLDHAANGALLLASIAARMEDRVGLVAFADRAEGGVGQGRGAAHLRRLTAEITRLASSERPTDYLALASDLGRRLKTRTLVVLFTALPELDEERTLARAVERLLPRHVAIVIAFRDPALEATATARPDEKGDLCRTLVARDLRFERRKTLAELRRRGALVAEVEPGDAGIEAIDRYLEVKRRQLL